MASMAGVMNTFSAQTSMAAAPINRDRTAVNAGKRDAYTVTEPACGRQAKEPTRSASGVEGSSCLPAAGRQGDPSPRLRLRKFHRPRPALAGAGRELRRDAARFPFPSPPRTVGDTKKQVK